MYILSLRRLPRPKLGGTHCTCFLGSFADEAKLDQGPGVGPGVPDRRLHDDLRAWRRQDDLRTSRRCTSAVKMISGEAQAKALACVGPGVRPGVPGRRRQDDLRAWRRQDDLRAWRRQDDLKRGPGEGPGVGPGVGLGAAKMISGHPAVATATAATAAATTAGVGPVSR